MEHILLLVVLIVSSTTWVNASSFCNDVQCPPMEFTPIADDTYVGTLTQDSTWVMTSYSCGSEACLYRKRPNYQLYMNLFAYMRGFNQQGVNLLNLTTPLLYAYDNDKRDGYMLRLFSYLPNPSPAASPISPFAYMYTLPAGNTYYFRQFSSIKQANRGRWEAELKALKNSLTELGYPYLEDDYFRLSYANPNQKAGERIKYMVVVYALDIQ